MHSLNFSFTLRYVCLFGLLALLVLSGCVNAATPIAYDHGASPEKTCTLRIGSTLTVKEFDGKAVQWERKAGDSWVSVQIPEGSHTFFLSYYETALSGDRSQPGIPFTYDKFVAGRTYQMTAGDGAQTRGFMGMFSDIVGTMVDTVQKRLYITVTDITDKTE